MSSIFCICLLQFIYTKCFFVFLNWKELKNNFPEILISNKCGVICRWTNQAEEDTRSEDKGVSADKVKRGTGDGSRAHPTAPDTESRAALEMAASFNQHLHPSGGFKVMRQVWGQAWWSMGQTQSRDFQTDPQWQDSPTTKPGILCMGQSPWTRTSCA